MMRRLPLPALLVTLLLVAAACGDDDAVDETTTTTAPMETTTTTEGEPDEELVDVIIQGFAFNPPTLTVEVGTTVRWMNLDAASHTATADDGTFSGSVTGARSFRFTPTEPGVHDYHCTIHPEMRATLIVEG